MAIRNPFEFSQYSSNFTVDNIVLDSSGIGITGISDLMSFIVTQTKIRQEAVRIGYIDNNPGIPAGTYDFVNLDDLLFDTPSSIFYASERIRDSIYQMFIGHPSRIYERSAYKPTTIENELPGDGVYDDGKPGGFFHRMSQTSQPTDSYYQFIDELVHTGSSVSFDDIDLINSPPNFILGGYPTLRAYLIAQVNWINSVIAILNQLRFIHKKLVVAYPYTGVESGNSNSGCEWSYSISSTSHGDVTNKPIEVILDMSEVVASCTDGASSYGYICIKWTSLNSSSRMLIMPTKSGAAGSEATLRLRKPIWGSTSSPDPNTQDAQIHDGNTGYYNSAQYSNLASGDDLLKTWDVESSTVYDRVTTPIVDSYCLVTNEFNPTSPFRNGSIQNEISDFACLRITNEYFTTNIGSEWDNKLRLVIFPSCSDFENVGFFWELTITCLGCIDCNSNKLECGGDPFDGSSSSSSQSTCNLSVTGSFTGSCLKEFEISLRDVELSIEEGTNRLYFGLCFSYRRFEYGDRLILLSTKASTDQETDILRRETWPGYGTCPNVGPVYGASRPFNTPISTPSGDHPRLGSSGETPSSDAIIFDSGCGGEQSFTRRIIKIYTDQVEMTNQASAWYRKIRLLCFGGCENEDDSVYEFEISCELDQCEQDSSSSSSSSNCIGYGSKINLYNGTKKSVESIRVGDELLSAVFTDAESKDNPELGDLVAGWSISDSSNIKLVKTYVKSIFIGTEPQVYRFSNEIYLTYDHPVLVGQPDGSYSFVSAKYLSNTMDVIGSNGVTSYLYPPVIIENKFVTFTIVTEPYNSIFVGGVLVHNASRESSQSIAGVGKFYTSNYEISHYQKVFGSSYFPFSNDLLNPFANSYINDGMYDGIMMYAQGPTGPIEGTSGSGRPTLFESINNLRTDLGTGPGEGSSSSSEEESSSSSSDGGGGGGGGSSSSSDDGGGSSSSSDDGGGSSSSSDESSSSSSSDESSSSSSSDNGGGGSSSSSSDESSSSSSSDDVFSSSSSSSDKQDLPP